jgi:adenylylsulfate kinase
LETGWCVWVTGLPGSGKSVISQTVLELLNLKGINAQILSSDTLRKVLTPNPVYSLEERDRVYEMLSYIAALLSRNGVNVIVDATANLRRYRDRLRGQVPKFIEVYVECPIEECMKREANRKERFNAPQAIYAKALKGTSQTVPGVGQPYEAPLNPEVTVHNFQSSPKQAAQKILEAIDRLKC